MCDCYYEGCKVCGRSIPVHITDFITPRENVEVFCGRHLPRGRGLRLFLHRVTAYDSESRLRKDARIGFRVIDGRRVRWRHHKVLHDWFVREHPGITFPPYSRPALEEVATPNLAFSEFIGVN